MRDEMGEDQEDLYPDESRSIEGLRHMRLMAPLRDMIDSETGEKVAKALGVSYRTVAGAVESGQLITRMSADLERHLLLRGDSAAAQQRESIRALEERVGALEARLGGSLEDLRGAVERATAELREEQAQGIRRLERRLAKGDAGRGAQDSSKDRKTVDEALWIPYAR